MTRGKDQIDESFSTLHHKTPLVNDGLQSQLLGIQNLYFKLDNLQPSSSFKIRGIGYAVSKAKKTMPALSTLVSSSGGNAGLAATLSAAAHGLAIKVFVPSTTSKKAQNILQQNGADVVVSGDVWDQAHQAAIKYQESIGLDRSFLVHPFEGLDTWTGHSTLVQEIFEKVLPDVIVCSVGGGGLFCGILTGLLQRDPKPNTIVVAVETKGAASFAASFESDTLTSIPSIDSIAKSLGARQVSQATLNLSREYGREKIRSLIVSDRQALDGVKHFANQYRMLVEPACGASVITAFDPLLLKSVVPELTSSSKVVVEVCGGFQVDLGLIDGWDSQV